MDVPTVMVFFDAVATRKVNDNNPALRQELQPGRRKIKYPDQIDFLHLVFAEIVANPAYPLKKIWIVTEKSDQTEGVLKKLLLNGINERGIVMRIAPVILFSDDKGPLRREAAMELHNSGLNGVGDILFVNNWLVALSDKKGPPTGSSREIHAPRSC